MITNYPHGVSSFGAPVLPYKTPVTTTNGGATPISNKHIWVHGNVGNDGNSGLSPDRPLRTMQAAFNKLSSGDVIHFNGNIREQLTTPVGIFDVTIIGEGNRPRNADAHTTNNGYSSATWKAPASPASATPLVKVLQQGWRFVNILFNAPTDAAAILLYRDGGAGDAERDASHAHILSCRFDAGQNAIEQSGGCAFVTIENCLIRGTTAVAIKDTAGAGIGTLLCWRIIGNQFHDNASHIIAALSKGTVAYNAFGKFATSGIVTTNGGYNMIFANALSGTYSNVGGYTGVSTDEWGGNFNSLSGGVTAADPA